MLKYLVLVGVAAQLFGITIYIRDMLKGKTKPNRVTWLLWFIAPTIGAVASFFEGVRWAVLPVFMSGFGPLLVLIFSCFTPQAYWKLERFDYLCGLFSLAALVFWGLTKDPLLAILLAIVSDGFAAVPTVIKSWNHPDTETALTYSAGIFSAILGLLAIDNWMLSAYIFPFYLILVNSALTLTAFHKKRL